MASYRLCYLCVLCQGFCVLEMCGFPELAAQETKTGRVSGASSPPFLCLSGPLCFLSRYLSSHFLNSWTVTNPMFLVSPSLCLSCLKALMSMNSSASFFSHMLMHEKQTWEADLRKISVAISSLCSSEGLAYFSMVCCLSVSAYVDDGGMYAGSHFPQYLHRGESSLPIICSKLQELITEPDRCALNLCQMGRTVYVWVYCRSFAIC